MFVSRARTWATSDYDGDDNNGGDNNTHAHTRSSQTKDQRLLQRCAMQCARKCGLERIRARSLDWGPHSQAPQTHSHIYTCTLATHTRTHTLTHTFACGGTIVSTNRAYSTATRDFSVQLRELCILQVHFMEYIVLY